MGYTILIEVRYKGITSECQFVSTPIICTHGKERWIVGWRTDHILTQELKDLGWIYPYFFIWAKKPKPKSVIEIVEKEQGKKR